MRKALRILCIVLALSCVVASAACAADTATTTTAATTTAISADTTAATTTAAATKTPAGGKAIKPYKIGISPLTTQHEYYIGYLEGVRKAAKARGVEAIIVDSQWDVAKQTSDIEDFVAQKLDAIICSPVDPKGIEPALLSAQAAGVPVLVEMTLIESVRPLIGTSQYDGAVLAGKYAGEWINKKYNGKCEVAILDFPYFQNVIDRVKGFKDGLMEVCPTAEIVAVIDAQAKMETAMKTMEDILQAHPNVRCVFGINDDSAKGANAAYQATKLNPEDVCIMGFDADTGCRKLIAGNEYVKGSVAADTDIIGAAAIDAAIRKIEGEDLGDWVEVKGAQYLVTKENISQYYTE